MASSSSTTVLSATLVVLLCFVVFSSSEAKEYLVGGSADAWKVPSSQSDSLNKWAQTSRFIVGDSLVWKYENGKDSVLQVSKEAYERCNTTEPIEEYKDGNTKVTLTRSGPYYFISGAEGHCEKGQKMIVVVISAKMHHKYLNPISPSPSPAPSPAEFNDGPAVAPTSGARSLQLQGGLLLAFGVFLGFALL